MDLWYESEGEGSPVLLIHAGVCDSRMWDPQWGPFTAAHRTVRCDLRGFGRMPFPAERFSFAADVVALLDRLELGPAALVGASLGGRVAAEVAVARPDLVRHLVLAGAPLPGHEWSGDAHRFEEEEEEALERGDLDAAIEANLRMWVDGPRREPGDVDPGIRRLVGEMQRRAFEVQEPGWEAGADEDPLVPDLGDRIRELSAPTLVLVGAEDVADMRTIADRYAADVPGARKAEIAGAAHLPSLERPEEFDRLVLEFLAAPA